jgi:UDP-N-acetylmuramate--alanine ligase
LTAAADWDGRRLHFVGIGGAGMSGLALVCARLGATVSGSDRAESSYIEQLRAGGLEPVVGHDAANVPGGAELVVSSAIAADNPERVRGRELGLREIHRGELLAELCAEKRLLAIAGTHGKTTTTAMTVWALRALGEDPAFFVGGEVPGLGADGGAANAGWGEGEWVVAEADESDGSFLRLAPEVAVVTNLEMDHQAHWGSLAQLHQAFAEFARQARAVALPADGSLDGLAAAAAERVGFDAAVPGPVELGLAVPGRHNRANARAALAAIGAALAPAENAVAPAYREEVRSRAAAALAGFRGVKRRQELKGQRGPVRIYDDYAHHPTEVRATLAALREIDPPPTRLIAVFQPHLYSRTKAFAEQFGAALALADDLVVLDVYPAREEPVGPLAGVSGLDVARAAADRMGGRRVRWLPQASAAERLLAPELDRAAPGAVLVTIGAGDVFRLGEALVDADGTISADIPPKSSRRQGEGSVPGGVVAGFPLGGLTTVRTGGAADFFATVEEVEALVELLRWAEEQGVAVGVIGSGSNLLVADDGFHGLAIKLDGALATIEREGERLLCGGGARLPAAATRAAGWGLSGIEFGVNIPGTAGGAVRMNANAYGGQLARVLEWVEVATARGAERRAPDELGFTYRNSNLRGGEVVSRAAFRLRPGDPAAIRAAMAEMRSRRHEAQPKGIKTFGSTFKNPEDERAEGRSAGQLLEAAGARGLRHGGARFSEKHANFVENFDGATTADVLELMAEGRRRVHERFGVELEPEVQVLGDVEFPSGWEL